MVYGGEGFRGDHEPILDAALFAAVQAKLSSQAVERRCRIQGSPALLTRRLFDEQGHRMTPTHTNKNGVRNLYYVWQAALRKESPPGSIARVPGPELEALVIDVLRRHLQGNGSDSKPISETDRELIELLAAMIAVRADAHDGVPQPDPGEEIVSEAGALAASRNIDGRSGDNGAMAPGERGRGSIFRAASRVTSTAKPSRDRRPFAFRASVLGLFVALPPGKRRTGRSRPGRDHTPAPGHPGAPPLGFPSPASAALYGGIGSEKRA